MADGCRFESATVRDSVIGIRSILENEATLNHVVMMGADFYETAADLRRNRRKGVPAMGIGAGSMINTAIIDKNARIGRNVVIRYIKGREDSVNENWVSRDGIVVIPKGAVIPDNTVI